MFNRGRFCLLDPPSRIRPIELSVSIGKSEGTLCRRKVWREAAQHKEYVVGQWLSEGLQTVFTFFMHNQGVRAIVHLSRPHL